MRHDALILVTRSGAEGRQLCRILQAQGVRSRHYAPVTLAGPEDPETCRRSLLAALPCQRLIVPSGEALKRAVELIGIEPLAGLPLIVPGAGTARIARALGFGDVTHPASGGTSEQILRLPSLQAVSGQRVVVLAAAGGRQEIARELTRRGAEVDQLHVYRRLHQPVPPDLEAELFACSDPITLLASGGALSALRGALEPATWTHLACGLIIAPSERVASLARAAGGQKVEAADGADHASMLRALTGARSDMNVCVTLG